MDRNSKFGDIFLGYQCGTHLSEIKHNPPISGINFVYRFSPVAFCLINLFQYLLTNSAVCLEKGIIELAYAFCN